MANTIEFTGENKGITDAGWFGIWSLLIVSQWVIVGWVIYKILKYLKVI